MPPPLETCANCGRLIGKLEQPRVWRENVVCAACFTILSANDQRTPKSNMAGQHPPEPRYETRADSNLESGAIAGTAAGNRKNSKAAVWSLILGISSLVLGITLIVPILAIILGIIGVLKTKKSHHVLGGRGYAIAGIILGSIFFASWGITDIALAYSAYQIFGPTRAPAYNLQVTFYDVETREIALKSATEIPPLIGSSGRPTLVRAYFFTCDNNCKNKKLYYLEKYDEKAREAIVSAQQHPEKKTSMDDIMAAQEGLLVQLPDWPADKWVKAQSPAGQEVYRTIACPDASTPPTPCNE